MSRQAEIEHPVNSDNNDQAILRVSVASPGPPCSFTQAEDLVKTSTKQSNLWSHKVTRLTLTVFHMPA